MGMKCFHDHDLGFGEVYIIGLRTKVELKTFLPEPRQVNFCNSTC
jgi:hypothetical protein